MTSNLLPTLADPQQTFADFNAVFYGFRENKTGQFNLTPLCSLSRVFVFHQVRIGRIECHFLKGLEVGLGVVNLYRVALQ